MAFVLLLVLSITTLVQVEQSSASISKAQLQSKQNALLALNQALGTLQAEMGPDQRISANADIFDNTGTLLNDSSMVVAHPYLVGAWDTSGDRTNETVAARVADKWEVGDPINNTYYDDRTNNGFRRWLISSDGTLNTSNMALASDTSFKDSPDAFKALGVGTLEPDNTGDLSASVDPDKEIWVPLLDLPSGVNNTTSDRIGWVVLDESVKARMNQSHQLAEKLAENAAPSNAEALMAWDNPGNLGVDAMGSSYEFKDFDRSSLDIDKVTSFTNASLFMNDPDNGSMAADTFGPYFHDLSLYSAGVMADVVNGGLKRDLSTLAEETPASYMDRHLYSDTTTGHSGNEDADPKWSAMLDYIGLYKDSSRLKANGTGLPIALMNDTDWNDNPVARADIDSPLSAPSTYRLAPAVAQFEAFFSILALKTHLKDYLKFDRVGTEPYYPYYTSNDTGGDPARNLPRMLNLCVTPVITLYNPYNVPIEFNDIWVAYRDLPIGLRFSRLGLGSRGTPAYVTMTDDFVPLATMNSYNGNYSGDDSHLNDSNDREQRFVMKLTSGTGGRRGSDPTVLAPGESIVFSPKYPGSTKLEELVNWTSSEQFNLISEPGYSDGIGLYWDALLPYDLENNRTFRNNETIRLEGYSSPTATVPTTYTTTSSFDQPQIYVNIFDTIKIEMAFVDGSQNPQRATKSGNNGLDGADELVRSGTFSIELYSEDPGIGLPGDEDDSADKDLIGRYTFDYNTNSVHNTDVDEREKLLDAGAAIGQQDNGIDRDDPDSRVVAQTDVAIELLDLPNLTREDGNNGTQGTVGEVNPHMFGSFRVGGKVTQPTTEVPFQPGPAYAFTNTSVFSGHVHVGEDSPTFTNYNLYINSPEDGIFDQTYAPLVTPDGGGYFFSGYGADDGTPFATQYEVPVTPLQSIASLQHANIAASGYLPQVTYAIGNSWAHPLINSSEALTTGGNYGFFDHSYLANTQLWDGYYFSTIADQQSVLNSSGDDYDTVVANFLATNDALPNPSYKRHLPVGTDIASATTELTNNDAYLKAAAYQLQEGTFNINSTSVDAWKAILATTNIANSIVQQPFYYNTSATINDSETSVLSFNPTPADLAVIYSRFRIPNYNKSLEESLDDTNRELGASYPTVEDFAIWQGYRTLDAIAIDTLANNIVDQIRYRGPFLSLADFINRRLGAEGDPRTQMGVIDTAIAADTTINEELTTIAGVDTDLTFESVEIEDHINDNDFSSIIANSTAVEGNSARGIPSYLTQADILQQIGSRLSARSDTFIIRAYGEVVDPFTNKVASKSLCEAVVQRIPDYVDASQEPYFDSDDGTTPEPTDLSTTNERFGRKFKIVQLNWLNPDDV